MRTLRATRYLDSANQWLAEFITTELFYLDFKTACRWYRKAGWRMRPIDYALLGCNDRFFLLTALLHRDDACHPWLYDRCREVEIEPDGYLDLWAREHYKSTIITFAGIIQEIMVDPEITVLVLSHNKSGARMFLGQIMQEFERNDDLRSTYSDVLWEAPRARGQAPKWSLDHGLTVKRQSNPKEPTILATGLVDGQPVGPHFKLLVYDDVVTKDSVTNPEMVKKTTESWELSDNLGAGNDVRKWHIGTRYSYADSWGIMLERGALKPRIYAATDDGRITGKPVFISQKRWMEKMRTQRTTLAAQMLQNPIAGQENTFRPEWLRRWEIRPTHMAVYILGDPAGSKRKGADRTAFAVIGIDAAGNKYLVDGYRHRMSLSERWMALRSLHDKWSAARGVTIVKVGYERYGLQADLEYFEEKMRESGRRFAIAELNWPREGDHSKKSRVERLEPDVRNSRFFLPATIFEPGKGECYWHVDETTSTLVKILAKGPTRAMRRMVEARLDHLICSPIRRLDEDRKPYDVTTALMEEMLFFPFAPKDDLVDAVSRIYDMEIVTPSISEEKDAEYLNSRDWIDA